MCSLAGEGVELVQSKMQGYMRPAEVVALLEAAERGGASAVLAWKDGKDIRRRDVRTGGELERFACTD